MTIHSHISSFYRFSALFLLMFPLCFQATFGQGFQKQFTQANGGFIIPHDICSDTSQGYFVTGSVQNGGPRSFIMQADAAGNLLWSKTYTAADPNFYFPKATSIRTTRDAGLIIAASKEQNTNETAGILFKTSLDGTPQWAKYASCLWRNSKVCADAGNVYYAANGKGVRKVFLGKVSNSGQVIWEQWLEAGDMDYYTVESIVTCANGNIVLALSVSKIIGGTLIGPVHTILFRIAASGEVLQVAYFPVVHLAALVPLSTGNIAFRCSASDVTWTGLGVMDAQLNWLWFKSAGLGTTPFLPNIMGQELAASADESRLFAIFYTSGGEKAALAFDLQGNFLQEEVYFAGPFAQMAASAPTTGYARVANISASHFFMARSGTDGSTFEGCFFPALCHLELDDTLLAPETIFWQSTPATCLQNETLISTALALESESNCVEVSASNADFQVSDTVICAGNTVNFKRNAGIDDPVFGTSEWFFEGGIPLRASGASVENVRYSQSGTYSARHVFNLAGCRDTAWQTITIVPPPPISLGPDTTLCPGDTLLLQAGQIAGAEFIWSTGATESQLPVFNPGVYEVTVTDVCSAVDAIDVSLLNAAIIELGSDTLICPDATIRLSAPPAALGYDLRWSTGDTGLQIDIASPGLYILRMSAGNCAFSDSIVVHAADCSECQVYAPNAFAPGSVRGGDIFRLYVGCPVLAGMLRIYDRWGNLLFESHDPARGWDGQLSGRELPPGVYLFDAQLQLAPVQRPVEWKRVNGAVVLVR